MNLQQLGLYNERTSHQIMESALNHLMKYGLVNWFMFSQKYDRLDCSGIDVIIERYDKIQVPLQFKSSKKKLNAHYQKYPHIPAVATGSPVFMERLIFAIEDYYIGYVRPYDRENVQNKNSL